MSAPNAKVLRGGTVSIIPASEVVVGDIALLEAGDFVPADGRIIQCSSLKSEESALTGESVASDKYLDAPVKADAPLGDRTNMVYSGCSIAYGRGSIVVTATGMDTEMGKIAKLLDQEDSSQTPLQQKLSQMGKYLGIIALAICAVIFGIGLMSGMPIMEIFMTSVSLAVAAIPEGLPAIVTIVLAMGVQRMVKKNAIIRTLPAVETLGSASIICSDKTGTLTQNRMTLMKIWAGKELRTVEDATDEESMTLLRLATLCCDGDVQFTDGAEKHIGDPTETAIVFAAYKKGLDKASINAESPRINEIPFDSDRKLMTTINQIGGHPIVIVKGAFDVLASRCIEGDLETAKTVNEEMGKNALRVLAVAYKRLEDGQGEGTISTEIENDLIFCGLLGMIDPPRPEAKAAVALCRKAGIKPVMITGDHVLTASAIAEELGILEPTDKAITGAELTLLSDQEFFDSVEHYAVYARVSPEDKIRIVKAWQSKGHVVSMTGDGVNDAPALKAADIGCAMGITGTDVAKGAADMTLTDDNFATIVDAVKEGRGIFDNIKKAVGFLLSCNVGEIFTVLISLLLWNQTPLVAIQLLWINLVTDGLPALALGVEAVESDIMLKKPMPKNESIFAHGMIPKVVLQGMMFAALTLTGFYLGMTRGGTIEHAETMAFLVLATSQIFHAYNSRSHQSLFKVGVFSNKHMNLACLVSIALIALIAFIPPIATVFNLVILEPYMYAIALGLSFVPVIVLEIAKAIMNREK